MDVFELTLDPEHPAPLYHQIATAVRWKIGTGALQPGALLPPLRAAADAWDVSYHTVRRAYSELADDGLVASTRGDGTRVLQRPREPRVRTDGPQHAGESQAFRAAASVVECNDLQAADLAGQVAAACSVATRPWHLHRDGEPPPGLIVGTRFHQGEILERWPHRAGDMIFGALRVDPQIPDRIAAALRNDTPVVMVERDVGTAHQHAADLSTSLGDTVALSVTTRVPTLDELDATASIFAIAPRLSDTVDPAILTHPRVLVPRHLFDPGDLETIRNALNRRLRPG